MSGTESRRRKWSGRGLRQLEAQIGPYAAIEEGVIEGETELITDFTEPIDDRTVVRYKK